MEKGKRKQTETAIDFDYKVDEIVDLNEYELVEDNNAMKTGVHLSDDEKYVQRNEQRERKLKPSRRKNQKVNYVECLDEEEVERCLNDLVYVNYKKNENANFQLKLQASWKPEEAKMMNLNQAPTFYPTKEEFEDPSKYISSIKSVAESFGICKIVPPSDWSPKCFLLQKGMKNNQKFVTRIQKIHKLQERSMSVNDPFGFESGPFYTLKSFKMFANAFKKNYFHKPKNDFFNCKSDPQMKSNFKNGQNLTVEEIEGEFWRIVLNGNEELEVLYGADIDSGDYGSGFDDISSLTSSPSPSPSPSTPPPPIPFPPSPSFSPFPSFSHSPQLSTLTSLSSSPMNAMKGTLTPSSPSPSPSPSHSSSHAPSHYSHDTYASSRWNLKNLSQTNGSVLAFEESKITGVVVPWMYIGMCFSSFCWHVEDHHLYSVNYNHGGLEKVWYGIPSSASSNFEKVMRKYLPHLFQEQPNLLHNLVTHFSPSILQNEGIPVHRLVQKEKEFVITFPAAYHSGFNCGFNCAEAVNFAPSDWFVHGQLAIDLYRIQKRKTTISHDKILIRAARFALEASLQLPEVVRLMDPEKSNRVNRGVNGGVNATVPEMKLKKGCYLNLNIDTSLLKALETRILNELSQRMKLIEYGLFFLLRMDDSFDAEGEVEGEDGEKEIQKEQEKECMDCFFDLHLSAISCPCRPKLYSCLLHFHSLCNCGRMKTMHYRYSLLELKTLLLSLKGSMEHLIQWRKMKEGLDRLGVQKDKGKEKEKEKEKVKAKEEKSLLCLFPAPVLSVSESVGLGLKEEEVGVNNAKNSFEKPIEVVTHGF